MIGFLPKPLRIDELSQALASHGRSAGPQAAAKALTDGAGDVAPGADNGSAGEPVLMDWSRLEQFREFDDDERTITRKVLALFASEAPQRMDDIRAALAASDSAALSRAVHAIKGAASNVGAQALSEACGTLEQACLQGQWPANASAQVLCIASLADKTCQAFNDWVVQRGDQEPFGSSAA